MESKKHIVVTGANKGIGLAIVKAILTEHADTFVYLGSRDTGRGREARDSLEGLKDRIEVVELDVTSDASVQDCVGKVRAHLGSGRLYGLVNNAGIGHGSGATLTDIVAANSIGLRRVTEAFLPLLEPEGGRVVNVTSASGPNFVSKTDAETRRLLTDPQVTWPALEEYLASEGAQSASGSDAYGLSKAVANAYTVAAAREHPNLRINACTPGFIETDLTRTFTEGKSQEEIAKLGMKPPSAGAVAPVFLLFGNPPDNGRYYGSDALRSPLDSYRSPGSPAYTGE
eukprot:TRINITY_DN10127_c0_g1_i1.p1 TRINITY_DN10127_c0_g1~~TRINITY_DN10127_c0_g1_i1.p1  ORF type:complete len:302 (+),score=41.41 TRINITY_DN10127_c0_g1_i1:53-907(+)